MESIEIDSKDDNIIIFMDKNKNSLVIEKNTIVDLVIDNELTNNVYPAMTHDVLFQQIKNALSEKDENNEAAEGEQEERRPEEGKEKRKQEEEQKENEFEIAKNVFEPLPKIQVFPTFAPLTNSNNEIIPKQFNTMKIKKLEENLFEKTVLMDSKLIISWNEKFTPGNANSSAPGQWDVVKPSNIKMIDGNINNEIQSYINSKVTDNSIMKEGITIKIVEKPPLQIPSSS